jgi:hypothetical protein
MYGPYYHVSKWELKWCKWDTYLCALSISPIILQSRLGKNMLVVTQWKKPPIKTTTKIGNTPSIPSSYKGLTIAILNKLSLKSNKFFCQSRWDVKRSHELVGFTWLIIPWNMLCSLPILLFCVQSIWKCVNFFVREGMDWIGGWPSSCVIACSSASWPKVSNQSPMKQWGVWVSFTH